jgi:hypothetical protein
VYLAVLTAKETLFMQNQALASLCPHKHKIVPNRAVLQALVEIDLVSANLTQKNNPPTMT